MNVVLLMSHSGQDFKQELGMTKYTIEIQGKLMVERVFENYRGIDAKFYFIISENDARQYKLDNIIKLIDPNARVIKIPNPTKGAACTALFASEYITNDEKLIIANGDQIINLDLPKLLTEFNNFDGGLLSFESLSPRYSYARTDENGMLVEIAEKNPISKNALCGLYYFAHGSDFTECATQMIKKDVNVNGVYYIAPVYNEMILKHKKTKIISIKKDEYHLFSTIDDVKRFSNIV